MSYKSLVETIVMSVVEHTDVINVEEEVEMGARTFYVHVHPDDVGKVIGKTGRVVQAIRCVVSAVASKSREKAYVKVVTD